MREDRKAARDFCRSMKTKAELKEYLDMLNLTDDEREIAWMMFSNGYSRVQIAAKTGYSERQIKRKVARIYDRMV